MNELEALRKKLNERFVKAFATYHLLEDGDHVLVGLSGGKDSLFLLETLARRSKIDHPHFTVEAAHVRMENISYETSTRYLEDFCCTHGVRLHTLTTRFEVGQESLEAANGQEISGKFKRRQKTPCFLCSWNRRKQLFNLAQELGCNKIALGHHQDDMILTTLMNLTFQGRLGTMPALLKMRKMPLSIIRPLCLMRESDIARYAELSGYEKQMKNCPYEKDSTRTGILQVYQQMEMLNPEVRFSLWNALNAEGKLVEE